MMMKRILTMALCCTTLLVGAAEEAVLVLAGIVLALGASAMLVLPQGGHAMRRLGGGTARFGLYLADTLAVEADAAWLETCAGLGVQGLWHFYGYERFDPFLTFGARGWIEGDVGPTAGLGAFYHLTNEWSLRGDAQATLGLDGDCQMVYSLGLGVQYSF